MSIKVTLRQKPISGDRASLFLDFYPEIPHPKTGKPTRREFLGMYIHTPVKLLKRKDKQIPVYDLDPVINETFELHNINAFKTAEQIRQQRQDALDKPEIYSGFERNILKIKEQGELSFLQYFKQLTDKRKSSNHDNWASAYNYLKTFSNDSLRFADLNEKFFSDFKEYLLTTKSNKSIKATLTKNSAASYFLKIKAALKQAYIDGYLQTDLNAKIKPIKQEETQRNFLTIEELNSLVKKDCQNPLIKNAALFSALTGLRFSDIEKLIWGELEYIEGQGHFIKFIQKKTKGVEMMPISDQAFSLLGERKNHDCKVFDGLTYSAYSNKHLANWLGLAGITKDITFHSFRHTYAVLQLSQGTSIYTVSKMLGHRELKTTQIYAKVMDKAKREATDKIKLDF